jgi:glycosyltransferase involved in cell wall biosynthesis
MTLITAILARNEADAYLERVVAHHAAFSRVLVLDDHSTDATPVVAERAGATVRSRGGDGPMWGNEAGARQELWDWATEEAGKGWVLIADADQILMGDIPPLCTTWQANTWCMPLYDCWDSETSYRADGYWQGYRHARPWLFRPSAVPEGWEASWTTRGIHSGHCPSNWPMRASLAPSDVYWLHFGWTKPEVRTAKLARYTATWDQLTVFEREHVRSITEV